jgi:hypothetical protein
VEHSKIFADEHARDYHNNMIGGIAVSLPAMVMYKVFAMLICECWKLDGIRFVIIN